MIDCKSFFVAINVENPCNYLNGIINEGITVVLLEKDKYDIKNNTYHNPMNVGFPNGTLKGTIDIELSDVIGGPNEIGSGWKMLYGMFNIRSLYF